jgi:hypothetical protein
MKPIDKKLNFLRPIKTLHLARFGEKSDGGYVVDSEIMKNTNTLITFGLGPNWQFELDYINANENNKVHIYDHTVTSYPYIKRIIKYVRRFITFKTNVEGLLAPIKHFNRFKRFLNHDKVNYFKEKISYPMLKSIDSDIDKVFSRINNNESVIIKCDIEGSEYDIIDQILKYSEIINMLIFEFHWIFSPDKSNYIGSYKDDKFHGNGSYNYGDGTKYIGMFKNGLPNGKGTYIYQDGSKYESEFIDGKGLGKNGIYIPTFKEEIFYESIKKLQKNFEITHLHGNNHTPVNEAGFPHCAEMTLVNKKLIPELKEFVYNLPLKDLDYPNQPFKDDIILSFDK